ncbi:MAG: hypothetical protein Q8P11_03710 [bacterium]|nr:hypothetical protein [bacterium]
MPLLLLNLVAFFSHSPVVKESFEFWMSSRNKNVIAHLSNAYDDHLDSLKKIEQAIHNHKECPLFITLEEESNKPIILERIVCLSPDKGVEKKFDLYGDRNYKGLHWWLYIKPHKS